MGKNMWVRRSMIGIMGKREKEVGAEERLIVRMMLI